MSFFWVCKRVLTDVLSSMCRQGSSAPSGYSSARTSWRRPSCNRPSSTGGGPPGGWEEPPGPYDGYPSSTKGECAFASTVAHCRGAREYQFSVEVCSTHNIVLLTAQRSAGRLEFPRDHIFVCLVWQCCMGGWTQYFVLLHTFWCKTNISVTPYIYIYIQFRVLRCRWFVHDDVVMCFQFTCNVQFFFPCILSMG